MFLVSLPCCYLILEKYVVEFVSWSQKMTSLCPWSSFFVFFFLNLITCEALHHPEEYDEYEKHSVAPSFVKLTVRPADQLGAVTSGNSLHCCILWHLKHYPDKAVAFSCRWWQGLLLMTVSNQKRIVAETYLQIHFYLLLMCEFAQWGCTSCPIVAQFWCKQNNSELAFYKDGRLCVYVCLHSGAQTLHLVTFSRPVCFCFGSFMHVTLWLTGWWVANSSTSDWPRPCTWALYSPIKWVRGCS